jgi:hypothetical protein
MKEHPYVYIQIEKNDKENLGDHFNLILMIDERKDICSFILNKMFDKLKIY